MSDKYFEIVVTARQLVLGIVGMIVLILVGFGLGVAVGLHRPAYEPVQVAAPPPSWTPLPWPTTPPQPTIAATAAAAPMTAATVMAAPSVPPPTVTPAPPPSTAAPAASAVAGTRAGRWVQVAALSRHDLAAGVRHRVVALGFTPGQVVIQAEGGKYRVRLGPFPDQESARRVEARLKAEGFPDAFVVKPGE